MANEGDEIQVNSLSPSTINIKKTRGVNYSVDPGNEGSLSSTFVLSEGEAFCNVVDVEYKINKLIGKYQEINSALDLLQKYIKKYASIQREIKVIIEAAYNTIGHIKDLLNKQNKIVEKYNRKPIESQLNIGQEKYGDSIKDGCFYPS